MRRRLWPEGSVRSHVAEMRAIRTNRRRFRVFVAERENGALAGFLEASLRSYADGCESSPVGYIEGWYVDPDLRRSGVGGELVAAAERWAIVRGCREMGSDCLLDNRVSARAHSALGYEPVQRLLHFRKRLGGSSGAKRRGARGRRTPDGRRRGSRRRSRTKE